jgi:riboflavin synthase
MKGRFMFTGIITHLGKIQSKDATNITIQADASLIRKIEKGTSIAVNGTCLTVLGQPISNTFTVEVMPETFKRTCLNNLQKNDLVNLELSMTPQNFLAGHIVQGHVDGTGKVASVQEEGNSKIIKITIPVQLEKYIVEKGSIALNGISLTVIKSQKTCLTVGIIPFTWSHTMLKNIKVGDEVNIETDIIAKYLEKLIPLSFRAQRSRGISY